MYRFIALDTFEERINDLINAKLTLADLTVGTREKWIGNLSEEELKTLFTLAR
ncbi:MAG: hypothetical protein U9R74_12905 [Pseudomonadota bacterium]|nr:hypothetical protein [Pseudomonadota bacterium]